MSMSCMPDMTPTSLATAAKRLAQAKLLKMALKGLIIYFRIENKIMHGMKMPMFIQER